MADPTITAKLKLDTSGYQKGVSTVKGSTSAFSRVGTVMAGVFGGNLLTAAASKTKDFFVGAVQGAMNAEQANTRFKTSLQNLVGATDAQVKATDQFLSAQSRAAAVSKGELRPAFETLLRGTHSLTGSQEALKTALDVSAGTGKPLASVAQAITKGFLGSTGGLQRMGIATKDASGKALSMTQIMANLNKTFGGQAQKQAGTMSGQMRNAGLQFKAFQVTIGAALLPVLKQLMDLFMRFLPILQKVGDWVKKNPALFKVFAAAILAIVVAYKIWVAVQWALNSAILANPIFWIIIGIAALVAALILAYQKVGWFRDIINTIGAVIKTVFNAIVAAAQWLISFFAANWPILLSIIGGPIGFLVVLIIKNWDTIKAVTAALVNALVAAFQWVKGALITIWNAVAGALTAVWNAIRVAVSVFVNAVIAIFNAVKGPVMAVVNVLKSVWNGFVAFLRGIAAVVRGVASAIGNAFGVIGSIVSGAIGIARRAIDGFVSFIRGVVGTVANIAGKVVGAFKAPVNALIGVWNGIGFSIPKIKLPDIGYGPIKISGPTIGGQHFQLPHIDKLAKGGLILTEGLAYLHAGERVLPAAQTISPAPSGPAVVIQQATFADPVDVELFLRKVAWHAATGTI
jgi:hypothetical protein